MDIGEEFGADKSIEKGSTDTEKMVNVLSLIEAANILSSKGATVSTASVSSADVFQTAGVPTVSGSFPTGKPLGVCHLLKEMQAHLHQEISLREVERFDPFFSVTQSGEMTWVMEKPSYRFPHMPLPRQVAYSPKIMEETDTLLSHFNDYSPDYETFCFDIEEKNSGSTTSHSYHFFPEYESFCFDVDHIEDKSSDSTTSHSDLSHFEYESFHFDISIDSLPPADRSDSYFEEFSDELAHIISLPEYDHLYFNLENISSLDPLELTPIIDESTLLVTQFPDSLGNFLKGSGKI
nr:NAC domain-containing protein [Tanacetum cinerariifolium]